MRRNISRRAALQLGVAAVATPLLPARAADAKIKIGVLTDMSGFTKDLSGTTSVAAAKQAVAEFTAANPSIAVEVLVADHQNKSDIGTSTVRAWFDRDDVDMVVDMPNSSVALACAQVAVEKNKVSVVTAAASSAFTGEGCTPNLVHWAQDTWSLSTTGAAAGVRAGGKTWFIIAANFAFGKAFLADATRAIEAEGGKVIGSVLFPWPETTDFSSYILQAQASRAEVVCFGFGGTDLINAMKQTREFGLKNTAKIASPPAYINDVRGMGLAVGEGLIVCEQFYWNLNDRTRAFYQRLKPSLAESVVPNGFQAGTYAGTLHYLKAVKELGVDAAKKSGRDVVAAMKKIPTDDDCFGAGSIRQDGRTMHPTYLFRVKSAAESKSSTDIYDLVSTIPAEQAFRPLADGHCPLVGQDLGVREPEYVVSFRFVPHKNLRRR